MKVKEVNREQDGSEYNALFLEHRVGTLHLLKPVGIQTYLSGLLSNNILSKSEIKGIGTAESMY